MKILCTNSFIPLLHILPQDANSKIMSYRKHSAHKPFKTFTKLILSLQEPQQVTLCPTFNKKPGFEYPTALPHPLSGPKY